MDNYATEVYVLKCTELLEKINDLGIDLLISKLNAALVASSIFFVTDEKGSKRYNQSKDFLSLYELLYPLLCDYSYYNQKLGDGVELDDAEFDKFIVTMISMETIIPKIKDLTIILAWYAPDFEGSTLAKEKDDFIDYLDSISAPEPIIVETFDGLITSEFSDGYEGGCLIIPANLEEAVWLNTQRTKEEGSAKDRNMYLLYAPLAYGLIEEGEYSDTPIVFLKALFNVLNYEKQIKDVTHQQIKEKNMDELVEMFQLYQFYLDMLDELESSYGKLVTFLPLDDINQVRGPSFQLKMQSIDGDLAFEPKLLEEENFYNLAHDTRPTEEFKRYRQNKKVLNKKQDIDLPPLRKKA